MPTASEKRITMHVVRADSALSPETELRRLRAFAELAADWYWRLDDQLRYCELTCIEPRTVPVEMRDAIGRRPWELVGVGGFDGRWEQQRAALQGRRSFRDFVYSQRALDGGTRWYRASGVPVYDATGAFAGYEGGTRDVTDRIAAYAKRRLLHERLDRALAGAGVVLWDLDALTRRVHMSESWTRFVGMPNAELSLTLNELESLVHPEDAAAVMKAYASSMTGSGGRYEVEHRVRTASGAYRWVLSRGKVTERDPNGGVLHMSGSNVDVTERHEMQARVEEALREQELLLEATPTGLAILREGRFVRANPAAEEMLGYGPGELARQKLASVFAEPGCLKEIEERLDQAGGAAVFDNLLARRRDGSETHVQLNLRVVEPHARHAICALVDVQRQYEATLVLQREKAEAQQASAAKSSALATTSHEIRTPMNAVVGLLDVLEAGGLNDAQSEALGLIREASGSMLELVDSLLDWARLEAGHAEMRSRPADLRELLDKSLALFCGLSARKGLALALEFDPRLACRYEFDAPRLGQVLRNALSNAIKFTSRGRVRLEARCLDDGARRHRVEFRVVDTGPGIPEAEQRDVFEPFARTRSTQAAGVSGTGLGLAISRRIVEAMGGEIGLHSRVGEGTTLSFTLWLPVAPAGVSAQSARSP